MAAFVALTDEDWVELLQAEGATDNVNFWSPGGKPLRNDLPGNRLFFLAKIKPGEGTVTLGRRVVGCANVLGFQKLSAEKAWQEFGLGNGAANLEEMMQRIGKFSSGGPIAAGSEIGCTVLDGVRWFDTPVDLAAVGIAWPPTIVRGRAVTRGEEERIFWAGSGPADELATAVVGLNEAFWAIPPRRREVVSQRIERNPAIVRQLKALHPDFCQYCGERLFAKKGGRANYSEIHHLKELCRGGLDVTENCLVLCATCHRKMHYGNVFIEDLVVSIRITEAGVPKVILKNRLVPPMPVRVF